MRRADRSFLARVEGDEGIATVTREVSADREVAAVVKRMEHRDDRVLWVRVRPRLRHAGPSPTSSGGGGGWRLVWAWAMGPPPRSSSASASSRGAVVAPELVDEGRILPWAAEAQGAFESLSFYYATGIAAACEVRAVTHRHDALYVDVHPDAPRTSLAGAVPRPRGTARMIARAA